MTYNSTPFPPRTSVQPETALAILAIWKARREADPAWGARLQAAMEGRGPLPEDWYEPLVTIKDGAGPLHGDTATSRAAIRPQLILADGIRDTPAQGSGIASTGDGHRVIGSPRQD